MLVGYARASTGGQDHALQLGPLKGAGCERVFTEMAGGTRALEFMRARDTLVVCRLVRLARSLKQRIDTVEDPHPRGIGFRSLTNSVDATTAGGELVFHLFGAIAQFERRLIQ